MPRRWPVGGRVLIFDDDPVFRASLRRELEQVGCASRVAVSHDLAINWLKKDLQLKVVLLDQGSTNGQTRQLVTEIHAIRSDVTIVGSGASDNRNDFAALGVDRFLQKPWRLDDLIDILTQQKLLTPPAKPKVVSPAEPAMSPCTETRIGKADCDTALLQVCCGQTVRVATGAMQGWTGKVIAQRSGGRILLQLEGGVFLEMHQFCVEILDASK